MSNHLAIATVTATLSTILSASLPEDVTGATVTTIRPDASNSGGLPNPGVNLFLYQATPNAAWRNADLPTRSSGGTLVQRPRIALDLHYLFTFHGAEATFAPQRVMGSVVRTMHSRPLLTQADIEEAIADPNFNPVLADADLQHEVERVKFTPVPLPLEELSKLWSVLFQTPYALSMTYLGTVVLMEPEVAPRRALPVRVRTVTAFPFRHARLEAAVNADGDREPLVADSVMRLQGTGLNGPNPQVRLFETELTPAPADISPEEVAVTLTGAGLRAGVQGAQLRYSNGTTSNMIPVAVRPRITLDGADNPEITVANVVNAPDGTRSAEISIIVSPEVGTEQAATLWLNGLAPTPGPDVGYSFDANPRLIDTDTLVFDVAGVEAGTYLVRVEVGGAESVLQANDATGVYEAPTLVMP